MHSCEYIYYIAQLGNTIVYRVRTVQYGCRTFQLATTKIEFIFYSYSTQLEAMLGVGGITEKHSVEQRAITGGRNSLDGNTSDIHILLLPSMDT